ncbi:hypothetical protein FPZ12_003895 [Amycolatopsis acidicola]|uniref:Uncharacterized protein n=1 Tax=Amycolatopsis acidicola TaxID=2596893 RepID=A0A5N0VLP1_9PSEU|nr:hypothetical protein [Amycolatopsis acidicola]KAA9166100.1 hypothetical protein FPZ12_003895 [Amycolatopsis acidicola]
MQPNPPQHGYPHYGGPYYGRPPEPAPPGPRANPVAAVFAGILALVTAGMLVWFALYSLVHGTRTGLVLQNAVGGLGGAGALVVAAGFTFARRVAGAWTLFALCLFYVVAIIVASPLLNGTALGDQLSFVFGFGDSDDVAIGLAVIFAILTATMAAIAAGVKAAAPATRPPYDPRLR